MPETTVEIPTRVLVMGMAHTDGTIVADEVHPVAQACGLTHDQVRSCLRRLVAEGLFARVGEGPTGRYAATDDGFRALDSTLERTRLAYAQDAAGRGWDGAWRLVAFAIPENKRAARDAFRDRLISLGGAAVQNGLYVSPHPWETEVRDTAEQLEVGGHTTLALTSHLEVGGLSEPKALADLLWSLEALGAAYRRFVDAYQGVPAALENMRRRHERLTEADFLPGALMIGMRFAECFDRDPLLPPELLPRPWPGRDARDLLLRSRRLGMLIREEQDRPALFNQYDELMDQLP